MTGPTFLGIGAQKAGTTWLHRALEDRTDVWVPPVKELHVFDEKLRHPEGWYSYLRGDRKVDKRWRRQLKNERIRRAERESNDEDETLRRRWASRYFFEEPSIEWYHSLFDDIAGPCGEITPDYAVLDGTDLARVREACPDVRAIYLLRNPIEREWSATMMATRNAGRTPDMVLRGRHPHVRYTDIIERWSAIVGPGALYVGYFDDLHHRPTELLTDILQFIGAGTKNVELPTGRPNSGGVSTMPGDLAVGLAEQLGTEIDALAERIGGHAIRWQMIAEDLRRRRPEQQLEYPLSSPHRADGYGLSSVVI
ncbi:MAG: sulfotransferase [Acidimicrobiales bacterium]